MATVNVRRRVRNGVDMHRGVRNSVQMIAVPLVINVRLSMRHVIGVSLRMQMRLRIVWPIRLIRLSVTALLDAVSVDHSALLRVGLTLNVLLLRILVWDHSALNDRSCRAIALSHNRLVSIRRNVVEVRCRVGKTINVSRCVRHRINMIAMLDVISVCRRVRYVVVMRRGVRDNPLGLSGRR